MSRSTSWRRTCPDHLILRIEQAVEAKLYLLRETGPTAFLVKEDELKKYIKVSLGDPHTCNCGTFLKERELCVHILWILLRKFRIPKDSPVVYQLGLVEREINEVIYGALLKKDKKKVEPQGDRTKSTNPQRKNIDEDDICPICHVELKKSKVKGDLTYCKFGCGNNIHITCMKVWAEHQKSTGEGIIKCPLCRADFGPYQALVHDFLKRKQRIKHEGDSDVHVGIKCRKCGIAPIQGKCYRCDVCSGYFICQGCFISNWHSEHSFQCKATVNTKWKPAKRETEGILSFALVNTWKQPGYQENLDQTKSQTLSSLVKRPSLRGINKSNTFQTTRGNNTFQNSAVTVDQGRIFSNNSFSVSGTSLGRLAARTADDLPQTAGPMGFSGNSDDVDKQTEFVPGDPLQEQALRRPTHLPPLHPTRRNESEDEDGRRCDRSPFQIIPNIRKQTDQMMPCRATACSSAESAISRRHKMRPTLSRRNLSAEILRKKATSNPDLTALNTVFQVNGFPVNS